MKVLFAGTFCYKGPIRHLLSIFEIYSKIAKVFEAVGIDCRFSSQDNSFFPQRKVLDEEQLYGELDSFDLVFIWNGELEGQKALVDKCRELDIPVYFSELGWLPQVNTFYFDRRGVNYASTLRDWEYWPLSKDEEFIVQSKLAFYHQHVAKFTGIKEDDFVFVPFQVQSDSQLKFYSLRIKKMQQFVDYVTEYIPGKIIFKKHPKDDPGTIKLLARCKLYETGTTHDFLRQCKYVVTLNSTVGVEALSYNKPVITLGKAFYGGKQLTYNVTNDTEMKEAVRWAEESKVALGVIQSFLSYLFKRQWHKKELENPQRVMTLLQGLVNE